MKTVLFVNMDTVVKAFTTTILVFLTRDIKDASCEDSAWQRVSRQFEYGSKASMVKTVWTDSARLFEALFNSESWKTS